MIKTIPQDSISVNSYIVKTHKRLQSVDAESADYYLNNSCRMRGQAATGTFSEVLDELDVESGKALTEKRVQIDDSIKSSLEATRQ